MQLDDFQGNVKINTEEELAVRLRSARSGEYGAFTLSHDTPYPALSILLNREIAYLTYFPGESHPGYQPRDMTPVDCPASVHFRLSKSYEADSIDMPHDTLMSADNAYLAAIEFFRSPELPNSVKWMEL